LLVDGFVVAAIAGLHESVLARVFSAGRKCHLCLVFDGAASFYRFLLARLLVTDAAGPPPLTSRMLSKKARSRRFQKRA
jgi:hypothetical protein